MRGPESGFHKKESKESRAEFAAGMRAEEDGMIGGVFSKIEKVPESLKRGIMGLMAAGVLFSATEASAQETWKKHFGYEGWQKQYGYGEVEKKSESGVLEGMITAADMAEVRRIREVDDIYQKKIHEIRLSVINSVAQAREIKKLDQWRLDQYRNAWLEREVAVHAAKIKSGQYQK